MYKRIEKQKENSSRAVANSAGQKKNNGKQDLEFMDNRPATIVQREAHRISKNAKQSFSIYNTAQLFAVPEKLNELVAKIHYIKNDIAITGPDTILPGSDHWGNETYWAANRKLDEWNLVKELLSNRTNIKDATNIGFGANDTNEADSVGIDSENKVVIAGENKIVSGKFSQVVENIDSALSQLTIGRRVFQYDGVSLIARINIDKSSEAYSHLSEMTPGILKAQKTRWSNRLKNAYDEGLTKWESPCSLRLWIVSKNGPKDETCFEKTIP